MSIDVMAIRRHILPGLDTAAKSETQRNLHPVRELRPFHAGITFLGRGVFSFVMPKARLTEGDFFSRISADSISGCWAWTGTIDRDGYGKVSFAGEYLAHRAMMSSIAGGIPMGMYVLHSCDNPKCVNPFHLRFGTQVENMKDCADRGRLNKIKGADVNTAVLNETDVSFIRDHYAKNMGKIRVKRGTQQFLAHKFGVTVSTISRIASGETWKHLIQSD